MWSKPLSLTFEFNVQKLQQHKIKVIIRAGQVQHEISKDLYIDRLIEHEQILNSTFCQSFLDYKCKQDTEGKYSLLKNTKITRKKIRFT